MLQRRFPKATFSLYQYVQIGFGFHPIRFPMGAGGFSQDLELQKYEDYS
jgi:hypothetical protein